MITLRPVTPPEPPTPPWSANKQTQLKIITQQPLSQTMLGKYAVEAEDVHAQLYKLALAAAEAGKD